MELLTLIEVCQAYRDLGDAVAEQLKDVAEDPTEETFCEQNSNALRIADERFLYLVRQRASWENDHDLAQEAEELSDLIATHLRGEVIH